MINTEPCRGCGRPLIIHGIANLVVRLEVEPLDAPKATQALLAGRNLWRITATSVNGARPAELTALAQRGNTEGPYITQEHRCTAAGASRSPSVGKETRTVPKAAQEAVQSLAVSSTPSSARPAANSGARSAGSRPSEPPCSFCGRAIRLDDTETYALIEVGAVLIDAFHTGECPA